MNAYKPLLFSILTLCLVGPLGFHVAAVPITLQSMALLGCAYYFGAAPAAVGSLVYLGIGALGAPVFAQFSGGYEKLIGPTAGFLWSFPLVAWMAGHWFKKSTPFSLRFYRFMALHGLLLLVGLTYLITAYTGVKLLDTLINLVPGLIFKSLALAVFTHYLPRRQVLA